MDTESDMSNITEQQYLELARDSQNRFNELDRKLKSKENEMLDLKKEILSTYGMIRIIDNLYQNIDEVDLNIQTLIETLRQQLSDYVEDNIL